MHRRAVQLSNFNFKHIYSEIISLKDLLSQQTFQNIPLYTYWWENVSL